MNAPQQSRILSTNSGVFMDTRRFLRDRLYYVPDNPPGDCKYSRNDDACATVQGSAEFAVLWDNTNCAEQQ